MYTKVSQKGLGVSGKSSGLGRRSNSVSSINHPTSKLQSLQPSSSGGLATLDAQNKGYTGSQTSMDSRLFTEVQLTQAKTNQWMSKKRSLGDLHAPLNHPTQLNNKQAQVARTIQARQYNGQNINSNIVPKPMPNFANKMLTEQVDKKTKSLPVSVKVPVPDD